MKHLGDDDFLLLFMVKYPLDETELSTNTSSLVQFSNVLTWQRAGYIH